MVLARDQTGCDGGARSSRAVDAFKDRGARGRIAVPLRGADDEDDRLDVSPQRVNDLQEDAGVSCEDRNRNEDRGERDEDASGMLVIVEPGTSTGWQRILDARARLIASGAHAQPATL